MKSLVLLFFLLFTGIHVFSQKVREVFFVQKCDANPVPEEGMERFEKYIEKKYDLSVQAMSRMLKGDLSAFFVVDKNGVMKDIAVQNDLGFNTGSELRRVLDDYASKNRWQAGKIDDNNVDVGVKIIVEITPKRASGHFKVDVDLQVLDAPNSKQFKKAIANTNFKSFVKQIVWTIDEIDRDVAISFDIDENGKMVNVEKISSGLFVDELYQKIIDKSERIVWKPARVGKEKVRSSYLLNVKFLGLINLSNQLAK